LPVERTFDRPTMSCGGRRKISRQARGPRAKRSEDLVACANAEQRRSHRSHALQNQRRTRDYPADLGPQSGRIRDILQHKDQDAGAERSIGKRQSTPIKKNRTGADAPKIRHIRLDHATSRQTFQSRCIVPSSRTQIQNPPPAGQVGCKPGCHGFGAPTGAIVDKSSRLRWKSQRSFSVRSSSRIQMLR
jgi:hypothetical protein